MLNDSYEPAKTVNGKPSFEAEMLWDTFRFCKQQLAGGQLDDAERKALEFYVEQMRDIHPCADENKFKKTRTRHRRNRRFGNHQTLRCARSSDQQAAAPA